MTGRSKESYCRCASARQCSASLLSMLWELRPRCAEPAVLLLTEAEAMLLEPMQEELPSVLGLADAF